MRRRRHSRTIGPSLSPLSSHSPQLDMIWIAPSPSARDELRGSAANRAFRKADQDCSYVEIRARTAATAAGLLANLQAARATNSLIKRDDNHSDILGEATCEIKLSSWPAPFCRELTVCSCYLDTRIVCR